MYACMYECPSHISRIVHLIDFPLGRCIAMDPREFSVKCEVDRMSGSHSWARSEQAKQSACSKGAHAQNGDCTSK